MTQPMKPVKSPWDEDALDELTIEVAKEVKARANAARMGLASDPVEHERVLVLLRENGYALNENQELISLREHDPLLAPGDLMRPYEH